MFLESDDGMCELGMGQIRAASLLIALALRG